MRSVAQRLAWRRLYSSGTQLTRTIPEAPTSEGGLECIQLPKSENAQPDTGREHLKTYAEILAEMDERKLKGKPSYRIAPPKVVNGNYDVISAVDLRRPISKGDLLLIASGPVVVVDRSTRQEECLTVANAVGTVREIQLGSVEARLGTLLVPGITNNRILFDKAGGKVVPEVHNLLAVELRNLYNRAAKLSSQLQGRVGDVLRLLQRDKTPRTTAFFDFAALVANVDLSTAKPIEYPGDYLAVATSRLTPELIYAVRMALDHYTLANKHVLEFSYLGAYCVTVLPRDVETRNIRLLTAPKVQLPTESQFPRSQLDYCKDYALGNLSPSNPNSDGLALEIIRRHPSLKHETLSRDLALELANRYGILNPKGPYLDKYAYHWMADPPADPMKLQDAERDLFAPARKFFEEPVYCIDSDTAHEIDDGISVRRSGDIAVIGVHIADPSSAFGTDLIPQIFKRPSTIYLPTGPLFMMSESVSEAFSLKPGSHRRALSVFTTYDLETGKRLDTRLQHSLLTNVVTKSYLVVDEELAKTKGPSDLATLVLLAERLERARVSNGAFSFKNSGSPSITIGDDGTVVLSSQLTSENSVATKLVTEMMIQANCAVAEYTAQHQIPNVYRSQTLEFWTSQEREQFLAATSKGKPLGFRFRANIPRARLSTGVSPHAALGVPSYSHFTSPLRRGQDVLTHLSVAHHLASMPAPFSHAKLGGMLPWIETAQLQVKQCQNTAARFWTLKAMEKMIGATMPGTICDVHEDFCYVFLTEYGVRARATFQGEIDAEVTVKLLDADAVGNRCVVCI